MSEKEISTLEPRRLWRHFAALNAIPRGSKKEQRAAEFVRTFGERLGLETRVDETGNVLIRKPATAGMETRAAVVMQGHLDMVHQKNAGTEFDFDRDGIRMRVEGDWVRADGTTLGADNGIGVAAAMAILESRDLPHPAIEALFTIDEESGMTGAKGLQGGVLNGEILLNLDTEDDDELTIGCAGGIDVSARGDYDREAVTADLRAFELRVRGLTGGHSGMDSHRGRANANKLMARWLRGAAEACGLRVASIDAGGLRNAIPREGQAVAVVPGAAVKDFEAFTAELSARLRAEYASTDPHLELAAPSAAEPADLLESGFQARLLAGLYACPNGIARMSPDIPGLVQTSNNLARVKAADGRYEIHCMVRGSVDSEKLDHAQAVRCAFEALPGTLSSSGAYPGWAPRPESPIVRLMSDLYQERFQAKPKVLACHAGLECGILGTHYPDLQMISFGPNIRGAHSPDEAVQISSVQKFWGFLLATLERIPESRPA